MTTRVLLVDDHALVRAGVRAILEQDPEVQIVAECGNGREAVRLARNLEPDVVVMDVAMPDLNGIDATQRIIQASESTRVLALSMHSDARYVQRMLQAGAAGYLLKDCAGEELAQAIRTVRAGSVYLSAGIAGIVVDDYVRRLQDGAGSDTTLTSREREVLQLIAEGHATSLIAERLHLSVKTIESHRKRIMDKLDLRSVAELTKYAIREGLTSTDP